MNLSKILGKGSLEGGHVEARWEGDDQNIIVQSFIGRWQWTDFFWSAQNVEGMMKSVNHPVDMVFDLSPSTEFPVGLWLVATQPWVMSSRWWPPQLRNMVIVQGGSSALDILNIRQKLDTPTAARLRLAQTLDEALTVVRHWT